MSSAWSLCSTGPLAGPYIISGPMPVPLFWFVLSDVVALIYGFEFFLFYVLIR